MLEKNHLKLVVSTMILLIATQVTAQVECNEKLVDCKKSLQLCDLVLTDCRAYVGALEDENTLLSEQLENKNQEIDKLEKRLEPLPWYWYAVGGLAIGLGVGIIK